MVFVPFVVVVISDVISCVELLMILLFASLCLLISSSNFTAFVIEFVQLPIDFLLSFGHISFPLYSLISSSNFPFHRCTEVCYTSACSVHGMCN